MSTLVLGGIGLLVVVVLVVGLVVFRRRRGGAAGMPDLEPPPKPTPDEPDPHFLDHPLPGQRSGENPVRALPIPAVVVRAADGSTVPMPPPVGPVAPPPGPPPPVPHPQGLDPTPGRWCISCGTRHESEVRYCDRCGNRLG